MLKTRADFKTEDEYRQYTKSGDFLAEYNWEGKPKAQIIEEMALPESEQKHLAEAMGLCEYDAEYTGYQLDHYILILLNMYDEEA